ncbi:MAG: RagB/SusD family nutrient uptake outer membrane protein, partial [Bacteroidia bacterium]
MKEDSIFHTRKNAEGYLWNTPRLFPKADRIWGSPYAPGELATDELIARWNTGEFVGIQFTIGEINAYNVAGTSMYIWNDMYKVINRCNEMLSKIKDVPGMNNSQRAEYVGYVHFMRAYAYYHLLQNWGPLLIVGDDVIDATKTAEYFNKSRSTYDESVDYIVNEFELAAKSIPTQKRM